MFALADLDCEVFKGCIGCSSNPCGEGGVLPPALAWNVVTLRILGDLAGAAWERSPGAAFVGPSIATSEDHSWVVAEFDHHHKLNACCRVLQKCQSVALSRR